jgi:hypothetical protein
MVVFLVALFAALIGLSYAFYLLAGVLAVWFAMGLPIFSHALVPGGLPPGLGKKK